MTKIGYHGTSKRFLQHIMDDGLLPHSDLNSSYVGSYDSYSRPGCTYFFDNFNSAWDWASSWANDPVVVMARLDGDRVQPDTSHPSVPGGALEYEGAVHAGDLMPVKIGRLL